MDSVSLPQRGKVSAEPTDEVFFILTEYDSVQVTPHPPLARSPFSHRRRLSLCLQILKCDFPNCGLRQFSLMCEADGNQSAFHSV